MVKFSVYLKRSFRNDVSVKSDPQRQITNFGTCVPNEDSDQPAHSSSLIRIFTGCSLDSQGCKFLHADNEDLFLCTSRKMFEKKICLVSLPKTGATLFRKRRILSLKSSPYGKKAIYFMLVGVSLLQICSYVCYAHNVRNVRNERYAYP